MTSASMMSEKDIYAAASRANVETKAKYFMTWRTLKTGLTGRHRQAAPARGQLDKINLCTVKTDGREHADLPTDAAAHRINVDNVKVVHQIVCDDNLEMLYKFDATNETARSSTRTATS